MPDMDLVIAEMIATLQEVRLTLEERFKALSAAEVWEVSELAKLLTAARSLVGQADSLLAVMLDRDVAEASLAVIQDLRASFEDLGNRIAAELGIREQ